MFFMVVFSSHPTNALEQILSATHLRMFIIRSRDQNIQSISLSKDVAASEYIDVGQFRQELSCLVGDHLRY